MREMKRTLIAAACLILLAGCGQQTAAPSQVPTPSPSPEITSVDGQEVSITFTGWSDGEPLTYTRTGTYTGDMCNGVPDGDGEFAVEESNGNAWTYTGGFKDGTFHGVGARLDENGYAEIGTYINGMFTPTANELLFSLSFTLSIPFDISDNNYDFIETNPDIFPAVDEDAIKKAESLVNHDLTYAMMEKNLAPYEGQLVSCEVAYVTQIDEFEDYGHTITAMICADDASNFYFLIYDGALPDVFTGSAVKFTALPLSKSGYDNAGGGYTHAIVLAGCSVTAIS